MTEAQLDTLAGIGGGGDQFKDEIKTALSTIKDEVGDQSLRPEDMDLRSDPTTGELYLSHPEAVSAFCLMATQETVTTEQLDRTEVDWVSLDRLNHVLGGD